MDNLILPVIGVIGGCIIPIVAIITDYFSYKSKMKVIEKAIEKGISLEGLQLDGGPRMPYRAGMVVLAVGLGVCLLAFFVGQIENRAVYPLLGLGAIPALIGIVLIINDKINYDRLFNKESDRQ